MIQFSWKSAKIKWKHLFWFENFVVLDFLFYVLRRFSLARWALLMALLILILEYICISVMIPLAASNANVSTNTTRGAFVSDIWYRIVYSLGLSPELITWVWIFLVLLALRSAFGYIHILISIYLSKQVHRQLSDDIFRQVLIHEPMIQVYKRSIGYYVTLAGDDTFRAGALVNSASMMLVSIFASVAGLILLFLFSPVAFFGTISFLFVSAFVVIVCMRFMLRFNNQAAVVSRESATTYLEALNGLRSIRSMGCESFAHDAYLDVTRRYTRLQILVDGLRAGVKSVPGLVALMAGVIALGPWFSEVIPLEPQFVFAGTTIIIRVFISLGGLMSAGGTFLVDVRAAKDLRTLIQVNKAVKHSDELAVKKSTRPTIDSFRELVLRQVCYSYANEAPVLKSLNFTFMQGKIYAIIGPSGSGKSTLADLLLGMLSPDSGEILMDGQVISHEDLRRRTVLVEQQARIFSVSVRDNLTLGLDVSDSEIEAALEAVDLLDFIRSLPDGIHTLMDYQGANFSGGQRQRLSIARALLRQPQILILDEATSALDSQTRDLVINRIGARLKDAAIIFITHDKTIAEMADDVLTLASEAAEYHGKT